MNKVIIDSKELAVGSWVKNNDEIARITSLYKLSVRFNFPMSGARPSSTTNGLKYGDK